MNKQGRIMLDPINFQKLKVCINITTHNYWMVYDFQLSLIIITRVCNMSTGLLLWFVMLWYNVGAALTSGKYGRYTGVGKTSNGILI